MRFGFSFLFVASALSVISCAPLPATYFEPHAEGAYVRGALCPRGGGPPVRAVFSLDPKRPYAPNGSWRQIDFYAPILGIEAFRDDQIPDRVNLMISLQDWEDLLDPNDPASESLNLFDPKAVKAINPANGEALELRPVKFQNQSSVHRILMFAVDVGKLTVFAVILPEFDYMSVHHSLPIVVFREEFGVFIYPINC